MKLKYLRFIFVFGIGQAADHEHQKHKSSAGDQFSEEHEKERSLISFGNPFLRSPTKKPTLPYYPPPPVMHPKVSYHNLPPPAPATVPHHPTRKPTLPYHPPPTRPYHRPPSPPIAAPVSVPYHPTRKPTLPYHPPPTAMLPTMPYHPPLAQYPLSTKHPTNPLPSHPTGADGGYHPGSHGRTYKPTLPHYQPVDPTVYPGTKVPSEPTMAPMKNVRSVEASFQDLTIILQGIQIIPGASIDLWRKATEDFYETSITEIHGISNVNVRFLGPFRQESGSLIIRIPKIFFSYSIVLDSQLESSVVLSDPLCETVGRSRYVSHLNTIENTTLVNVRGASPLLGGGIPACFTDAPSPRPSVSISPSVAPSVPPTPFASQTPTVSIAPSMNPTTSMAPSEQPSDSLKPSEEPTLSLQPSEEPSLSAEPSATPSLSSEPSSHPSVSPFPSAFPTPDQLEAPSSEPTFAGEFTSFFNITFERASDSDDGVPRLIEFLAPAYNDLIESRGIMDIRMDSSTLLERIIDGGNGERRWLSSLLPNRFQRSYRVIATGSCIGCPRDFTFRDQVSGRRVLNLTNLLPTVDEVILAYSGFLVEVFTPDDDQVAAFVDIPRVVSLEEN